MPHRDRRHNREPSTFVPAAPQLTDPHRLGYGAGLRGRPFDPPRPPLAPTRFASPAMHYPHKISRIKKVRKVGFRARMRTRKGRAIINSKRRLGRRIRVR